MQASVAITNKPELHYLLRVADTGLVWSQRLAEWAGHAPMLEEDIALANMALDLLGQARALLTHAGRVHAGGLDEDQLAFLRDERDYLNLTLAELPRGDFAFTALRNVLLAALFEALWRRLQSSSDAELAAIAGKALKEARYHREHAADWVVRLGDGTDESARRLRDALQRLWPYVAEIFDADEVDAAAARSGLGPSWAELRDEWLDTLRPVFADGRLEIPPDGAFRSTGKRGRHSEHMGYLLAEMQHLARSFPGAAW